MLIHVGKDDFFFFVTIIYIVSRSRKIMSKSKIWFELPFSHEERKLPFSHDYELNDHVMG